MEKRRHTHINVYKCAPEGGKLFSQVSHDRKKVNGYKLKYKK